MYIGSYILISQAVPCSACSEVFELQHLVHWVPFVFRPVPPLPSPRMNINKCIIQDICYVPPFLHKLLQSIPDSKAHWAHLVLLAPGGPPVGPMNLAIRDPFVIHIIMSIPSLIIPIMRTIKTCVSLWISSSYLTGVIPVIHAKHEHSLTNLMYTCVI